MFYSTGLQSSDKRRLTKMIKSRKSILQFPIFSSQFLVPKFQFPNFSSQFQFRILVTNFSSQFQFPILVPKFQLPIFSYQFLVPNFSSQFLVPIFYFLFFKLRLIYTLVKISLSQCVLKKRKKIFCFKKPNFSGAIVRCKNWWSIGIQLVFPQDSVV